MKRLRLVVSVFFVVVVLSACRRDMADQPKFEPLEANPFFSDGAASRPLPPHTVAQGNLRADALFYTGHTATGELATVFPAPVTPEMLQRGRQRYDIFCAVCHGATGDGRGMIVQRGFPPPPSFHQPRLREAPVGHFYDVITRGYGVMYSYAARVAPADRWAIAAYLRALQQSENTSISTLSPAERAKVEAGQP